MGKNGKSTKHRKTRPFLATRGGRRQGARPLSPTERRETPSARTRPGGPWPDLRGWRPTAGQQAQKVQGHQQHQEQQQQQQQQQQEQQQQQGQHQQQQRQREQQHEQEQ